MNANSVPHAPALWRQLTLSAIALQVIREGASGTAALNAVEPGLRPGVQAIVFHVLRRLGRAQALREQLAPRAPPALADALLCTALALASHEQEAPYDTFTLVDQAVEAAKRHPGMRRQAGFINACLRRFLRERTALVALTDRNPVALWNHPAWWIARLRQDHPAHWQEILLANNAQAPMTLRINERKVSVVQYLRELAASDIVATPVERSGAVLQRALPVDAIPGFAQGLVSVQDAAAQRAAPLLLAGWEQRRGLRVLDACAAPGGKTAHLLELMDAQVTALDIDPARCERIHQNLRRLELDAQVIAADAANPTLWWPQHCGGEPFDAILLDAPCTASGIVRRHPDVRWLRRESDIAQLAGVQAALLAALWPLLKPGGRLLYCTCSVFRAEGYEQIQTFVTHNTDAALRPSPGHLIPQIAANGDAVRDNHSGDHDGFFYALLEKTRLELAAWMACVFFVFAPLAHADPAPAEVSQFQVQSDADGVYLTASVKFQLSAIVEDALRKGIPMFFVAEADVLRDRWYWTDKRVASVARHMRLAYQPLTRGWRLNVSPDVISDVGLGLTLNQNFDSLADALAAIQRISHWKIANAADVEPNGRYSVNFQFRLDVSQLPRPFQIGAVGESDWTISASRQQRLVLENKQ